MSIDGKARRDTQRGRKARNRAQARGNAAARRTVRKLARRPIPEG